MKQNLFVFFFFLLVLKLVNPVDSDVQHFVKLKVSLSLESQSYFVIIAFRNHLKSWNQFGRLNSIAEKHVPQK